MKIEIKENSCIIDGVEYEKKQQPTSKDGEIMCIKIGYWDWVYIHKSNLINTSYYACYNIKDGGITIDGFICSNNTPFMRSPATHEHIALLHTKLKENGKVWNPDTKTLEDYRELRKDELAIFWNFKDSAIVAPYRNSHNEIHITSGGLSYINATPFESIEQYEQFRKS